MLLNEYPSAIASVQSRIHELDVQIERLHQVIKQIESQVDSAIAFDESLRNDAQRKAKRQQFLEAHQSYWELQEDISDARAGREINHIELCRLRDEFSVLKLEKQENIARLGGLLIS
ncbi:hypothetical protein VF14_03445 [Nostoc linckia z18]|uniref:Uncharacterized protein n=2 Tax=Nostoc linckia TaxID=92942 RepID=A0A9Q5ZH89_NOSLI|nr:hypothetical protein [Nostoc linckia]PHK41437.1 hypothetical protein VF12_06425 [Nostoc linckia z15]PHK46938.1 hypothetical protein VF13_08085 [Nostoc linckia z16]PHJ69200.1 hypothetical protein VF02_00915 [Nostoc linckia z1]PHJ73351.1 hypothetical protein VF05_01930 [Nostoc linckia z3]PHJ78698.1 hypothetical protein VF03_00915 [Nostoc linckia z2]